jgi:hypothetical protein
MVDLLLGNLSDPNSLPVLDALHCQQPANSLPQALSVCTTRFQVDDLLTTFIRNELLVRLHRGILEG